MSNRSIFFVSILASIILLMIVTPRFFTEREGSSSPATGEGIVVAEYESQERTPSSMTFQGIRRTISTLFAPSEPLETPPPSPTPPSESSGEPSGQQNTLDENFVELLQAYGNNLASTLRIQGAHELENAGLLNDLLANPKDAQAATSLSGIAVQYDGLVTDLANIETPVPARAYHEALQQKYTVLAQAVRGVATAHDNENAFKSSVRSYNETSLAASNAVINIAFFFKEQGVTFSPSEPGFVFTLIP